MSGFILDGKKSVDLGCNLVLGNCGSCKVMWRVQCLWRSGGVKVRMEIMGKCGECWEGKRVLENLRGFREVWGSYH